MMPVFFKMAGVNAEYLKVTMGLFKRWHLKYARQRIQHEFEERMEKSVPWVTVWHHSAEPCDAKHCHQSAEPCDAKQ